MLNHSCLSPASSSVTQDGGAFISINDEPKSYVLKKNDGTVIDGPTIPTVQGKSMQRVVPVLDAGEEEVDQPRREVAGAVREGGGYFVADAILEE